MALIRLHLSIPIVSNGLLANGTANWDAPGTKRLIYISRAICRSDFYCRISTVIDIRQLGCDNSWQFRRQRPPHRPPAAHAAALSPAHARTDGAHSKQAAAVAELGRWQCFFRRISQRHCCCGCCCCVCARLSEPGSPRGRLRCRQQPCSRRQWRQQQRRWLRQRQRALRRWRHQRRQRGFGRLRP